MLNKGDTIMKRIQIDGKNHILITPKELERMADWLDMASNCGDNHITKQDTSLQDKILDMLDTIKKLKHGIIYASFK